MTHVAADNAKLKRKRRIAIVGTGASGLYLLKNILERADSLAPTIEGLVLFERGDRAGVGMPYHPATTDRWNLCNISSEELPHLQQSLTDWLREQSDASLARFDIHRDKISDDETYPRLILGEYFAAQFQAIVEALRQRGIAVEVRLHAGVDDLRDDASSDSVIVVSDANKETFDRLVISTGHAFEQTDDPQHGFYASPWPIQKLLPASGLFHNTTIGTLGASLSAFDVVTSLAHRHGRFEGAGKDLRFIPDPRADQFRIVMHSSNGWLPHLQYAQSRPFREVYRYLDRKALLALRDQHGFLRLQTFFDEVCRRVLGDAFDKDHRSDIATKLRDRSFTLESFVETLSAEHAYDDAFDGMRKEYPEAQRSVRDDKPIYWKEALDDLMYTLGYHADLMPAEDHQRFAKTIVPFLMNVIAAMPLSSADILLALHTAGRLELKTGRVKVEAKADGETVVNVTGHDDHDDQDAETIRYRLFVDCTGQSGVALEDFPFRTLVKHGEARQARARFASSDAAKKAAASERDHDDVFETAEGPALHLDGIDVDAAFRLIGDDGHANPRLHDVAFPHTTGLRPYCYGLQACNHNAGLVVEAWHAEAVAGHAPSSDTATLTRLHDKVANES